MPEIYCSNKQTPLTKLQVLHENQIYIKRDDLFPFSFGGNKARKGQLFFEEIEKNNCDCVVTYGTSSSNHCRIVANLAYSKNMPCYIISPIENYKETYNSKMIQMFNANIIQVPVEQVHDTIEQTLSNLKNEGFNPYFIEGGGHGNIGTEAIVGCYNEIKQYEIENDITFDYIFFATGTGTTQAGLVCGKLMNHDDSLIIGISIARKKPRGREVVLDSIYKYLNSIEFKYHQEEIEKATIFIDDYTGDSYGSSNEEIKKLIEYELKMHGLPLDTTYTGKAFFGMQDYIKKNEIKNKNILFIHTGGTPLFFDSIK